MTDPLQDVEIILTPTFGDPDLYVLVGPYSVNSGEGDIDQVGKNPGEYTYRSINRGSDRIVVYHTDNTYVNLCNVSQAYERRISGDISEYRCVIQILVYGYSDSEYSITAGTSDRPIALADGRLTTSTVQKHDFVKYSFYVDQMESDVDIVITPQVRHHAFIRIL